MKFKADWNQYLHEFRQHEFECIFRNVPPKSLGTALELGAGDGFQTTLLAPLCQTVLSTDFSPKVLTNSVPSNVTLAVCDAEAVDTMVAPDSVDFIFSSSMFEHLPHPEVAMKNISKVLRPHGVMVHIMPNPFWKFSYLASYYPSLFLTALEVLTNNNHRTAFLHRELNPKSEDQGDFIENNQKNTRRQIPFLRHVLPAPHGVSEHHWQEFGAFSARRWKQLFDSQNLHVHGIIKGPVTSGNGIGLKWMRIGMEKIGASSVNAFVVTHKNSCPPQLKFFLR